MKSSVFLLLLAIVVALPTMADGSWWGLGKIVCKWYGTSVTADDAQMEPTVFDFVGDPVPKRPVHDLAVYEFIHKDVNRVMPTNQPIVVVADVMSVTMAAVTGLDDKCRSLSGSKSLAWYRVTVHVRRVERGELMNRWLSFPVSQDGVWDLKLQGGWLFYRGITLKLGLSQKDGGLILDYAVPTLPYPPYSTEGIQVYGGSRGNMPETNAFTRCDGVRRMLETEDRPSPSSTVTIRSPSLCVACPSSPSALREMRRSTMTLACPRRCTSGSTGRAGTRRTGGTRGSQITGMIPAVNCPPL